MKDLLEFYSAKQALEMTMAIAGYNSMNRWTDGLNIPGEENGNFFKKEGAVDLSQLDTPTSEKYASAPSQITPKTEIKATRRPSLSDLYLKLGKAAKRQPTLPLADFVPTTWNAPNQAWVRLLATFSKSGKSRHDGVVNCQTKGSLSPKLRAAIAWVAAREDQALYALDLATKRLKDLGLTEKDIFGLDAEGSALEPGDRRALGLVRKLTATPALVADGDVVLLRKAVGGPFSDNQVAEIVHHICNASFFNRVTEAANLPVGN